MVAQPSSAPLSPYLAEARASLCLVESLMLALLDARLLTREQILFAVDTAIRTKRQAAVDGDDPAVMDQAAAILGLIANSLEAAPEDAAPAIGP